MRGKFGVANANYPFQQDNGERVPGLLLTPHMKPPEVNLPQKSTRDVQNAASYSVPVHSALGEVIQSVAHSQFIFRLQQGRRGTLHKHSFAVFGNFLLCSVYLCTPPQNLINTF